MRLNYRVDIFRVTVTNFYGAFVKNLVQNMADWKMFNSESGKRNKTYEMKNTRIL